MQRKEKDNRPLRRLVVYSLKSLFKAFSHFTEQVMGIEPTYLAWKASVLPLNYTCNLLNASQQCPEPESNQRHEDFQSSALPTELSGHLMSVPGFEPGTT